jgi:branched-chain amino acid transport system ATP-binding protein
MTSPTLEVTELDAGYGDVAVLRDVTMQVRPGSVVALLGPNGAGKTTLLRVMSGLLRPTQGRILLEGRDVTDSRAERLAQLGMCHIPEGRGIFPSLSVRDNLLLFAPQLTRDEIFQRALGAFPTLGSRMSLAAGSLSGGEQQMLALARAYLVNPRLVLVDEASMGLAPLIVDEVFEFLKGIAEQGAALLLVEQYVNRALALADHAYILSQGRIVFAGRSDELDSSSVFQRYLGVEMTNIPA